MLLTGRRRSASLTADARVFMAAKSSKVGKRGLGLAGVASSPSAASSDTMAASTCTAVKLFEVQAPVTDQATTAHVLPSFSCGVLHACAMP